VRTRFPNIIVLGIIVAILAGVMNKWVFMAVFMLGGVLLAVVVWKLVSRGQYVPPTILLDEARERFSTVVTPELDPAQQAPDATDRNRSNEQ